MATYPRPERGWTLDKVIDWGQNLVQVLKRNDASGSGLFTLTPYTKALMPIPASGQFGMIYVTDATGGAIPAFFDGAAWRRVDTRAVIT